MYTRVLFWASKHGKHVDSSAGPFGSPKAFQMTDSAQIAPAAVM
jgi:hypothetical protein